MTETRPNTNRSVRLSPLDLLIFVPILAAAAMAFGAPARLTAIFGALINAGVTAWLLANFTRGDSGFQFTAARPILTNPVLGFNVGIDGMSLVLVLLTAIVTLAAVWMRPLKADGDGLFYSSSLLIAAGAMGAFVSTDIFFFYAFHELALIPTFLMIGMRGTGDNRDAAWKITIYLGVGSLILLVGLAGLVFKAAGTGNVVTFDMLALRELAPKIDPASQQSIYLTLLIGFGVLISLFPFHSWAAPAYASAPAPTAMMHAGVLKKFGLYGLLRIAQPMLPLGAQAEWIHSLLLFLLLGNILYIGLVTIAQKELDLVLGNSSVMHMGYVFLGIASGSAIGYSGAVMLMFAHGVSIALLFALCSYIREKTGTLQLARLGGLAKHAPFLGLAFAMATFASIGLPGFANFASELLVFFGGFAHKPADHLAPLQVATILALWGVVISAVYMLRAFRAVFKGEPADTVTAAGDISLGARVPVLLLLAALLITGFFPNLLLHAIDPVAKAAAAALR